MQLSKNDPYRETKLAALINKKNGSLEAAEAFDKKTKRQKRKK